MEEIVMAIAQHVLSQAFSDNGAGNTSVTKPNTNSGKSISQLIKGA